MNLKVLTLSVAAAVLLTAASPMVPASMSTDNGGTKLAIDAYSDGAGVLLINQAADTKFDNSAMNKLVFKYGDAAKSSNTTLKNQVNVLSPGATALEKTAATTSLETAKLAVNPPVNGTACDDGLSTTSNDVWMNSVCAGSVNDGVVCDDSQSKTFGDKYTSGVCAGTVAISCKQIKSLMPAATTGVYSINPDSNGVNNTYNVYCDMTTDGGGWTLVWSNLINRAGNLQESMTFATATTTRPVFNGSLSATKENFEVYTGLNEWNKIGGNAQMDIMYQWSATGAGINQAAKARLIPFVAPLYILNVSSYQQLVGSATSGFLYWGNGVNFTASNYDQDTLAGVNCAGYYTNTPWWYTACWNGSINGGGASSGSGYFNGAYWINASQYWGVASTGEGAGSGWIFIR